jgi:hypothetical protein
MYICNEGHGTTNGLATVFRRGHRSLGLAYCGRGPVDRSERASRVASDMGADCRHLASRMSARRELVPVAEGGGCHRWEWTLVWQAPLC